RNRRRPVDLRRRHHRPGRGGRDPRVQPAGERPVLPRPGHHPRRDGRVPVPGVARRSRRVQRLRRRRLGESLLLGSGGRDHPGPRLASTSPRRPSPPPTPLDPPPPGPTPHPGRVPPPRPPPTPPYQPARPAPHATIT